MVSPILVNGNSFVERCNDFIWSCLYYYFIEKPSPDPTFISKLNTFLQIFFVLFVIAGQIFNPNFDLLIQFTGALVFLTSILSGVDYWISWSIRAKQIITARAT